MDVCVCVDKQLGCLQCNGQIVGVCAVQVLRVLVTLMSDFGNLPLARRLPPIKLGSEGAQHVLPLAQHAVAALQV